jgi:galactan endo-1,6-beta-galactosidase
MIGIWKVAALLMQASVAANVMATSFFTLTSPLPGSTVVRGDGPYTIGNVFIVTSQNLVVDKLGVMDVNNDGFYAPVEVGVWTSNGSTLLGTATVASSDPWSGGYRYHSLASPLTLAAGTSYLIGARVGSGIEWFRDSWPSNLVTASSSILVGDSFYSAGDSLAAPTNNADFAVRWAAANASFTTSGPPMGNGYSTTINPNTNWGPWDGWGVSLCWWASVFGNRDDLADLVFTTNYTLLNGFPLPGLGMNIVRYNAGGCGSNSIDGTTMQVSPNIPPFRQIPGYWLDWFSSDPNSGSWDWSADANQRAMLLKAKARGANRIELFSNSPMWWMCYNHNPSGATVGSSDNLQSWNYDQHAIYLAAIAKYAKDNWDITFDSVEPFNEPAANWWTSTGTQEGCHFTSSTQSSVIGYLRNELDSRGLTSVKVAASDENTYDAALATWNSINSTVQAQVGRVNVHGYQYANGRRDLLYSAVAGKGLWDSEYGDNDGTGISLAGNLNLDFRWLHPSGWCYWQAFDSGGWGLIQSNPGENWIGPANRKYFVLAQYTRHIKPGMTLIDGGEGNTLAAYDPAARKLIITTANYGTAQWITYNLTNYPYANGPIQRWTTVTGSGPNYQFSTDVTMSQRTFRAWFPANTVETFEIQNVDFHPPAAPLSLFATPGIGKVNLAWSASTGATNYVLTRTTIGNNTDTNIINQSGTNFTDNAVVGGATYSYLVSAVNGAGSSAPSTPAFATPYSTPNLTVQIQSGGTHLTLSWPAWAADYKLYETRSLTLPIQWSRVANSVQTDGNLLSVSVPLSVEGATFYRLGEP